MNSRYILFTKTKSLWNGKPHIMILMSVLMLFSDFPRDQAFPFLKHANIQIYARVLREYVESTGLDILAYLLIDIHCSWYICQPNYGIRNAEVRRQNLIYQIFLFLTLQLFIGLMQISQMKIIVVIHFILFYPSPNLKNISYGYN